MNSLQGMATVQTENIEGELKAVILRAPQPLDVKIVSEEGYTLLDISQHSGVCYIPLSARMVGDIGWAA